jgi:hypothetical protein
MSLPVHAVTCGHQLRGDYLEVSADIGARGASGARVTYDAHISHSGANPSQLGEFD